MTGREKAALRELMPQMLTFAQTRAPEEACGLLEYDGDRLTLHACENVSEEPRTSFLLDFTEQLRVLAEIEQRGTAYWGIFHSHPTTDSKPSVTDRAFAEQIEWPLYWVILGLRPKDPADTSELWAGLLP